jgi:2,3-bisphosphoglycerate-dependent phosphoglycerate mutase
MTTTAMISMQEPTRILAIRHGETAWNVDVRIQGNTDIALNARGRDQALRLGAAVGRSHESEPVSAIYSSDLARAFETAQAVANNVGLAVQRDVGLRERGFGIFEGQTFDEVMQTRPEDAKRWRLREPDYCPEGGESLSQFRARILRCVEALAEQHPGEQIAVVAHGGVMDVLYRAATGQSIQAARTWALGNAVINRLLWTPAGFTLVGWNDAAHLDEDAMTETHS